MGMCWSQIVYLLGDIYRQLAAPVKELYDDESEPVCKSRLSERFMGRRVSQSQNETYSPMATVVLTGWRIERFSKSDWQRWITGSSSKRHRLSLAPKTVSVEIHSSPSNSALVTRGTSPPSPSPAAAAEAKGDHQYKEFLFDKALASYREAQTLDPCEHMYTLKEAAVLLWQGDFESLTPLIEGLIEKRKQASVTAEEHHQRGNQHFTRKEFSEAIEAFSAAIEANPGKPLYWSNRSYSHYRQGGIDSQWRGLRDADKFIAMDPTNPLGWNLKGACYHGLQEYDLAVRVFTQAIELAPKEPASWTNRGDAYRLMGQYQLALKDANHSIQLNPEDSHGWAVKGMILADQKRFHRAIAALKRAVKRDPHNSWYRDELSKAKALLNDPTTSKGDKPVYPVINSTVTQ
eukprot:Protomagalhaensia_wolfi_Nauph_80__5993@NODE_811_length_1982_cov_13_032424_g608_i0_p1_GENE_NODE_811_length_1982_cov_13_032424_g608_i0NODE_811_length_1982_cov_13_032424_g608_i0_p1_ORF_typecomplete_len404_score51_88TPR_16/PF13432_6/2_5e03TPR_16/PF13432_6/9TPR_16/PF13432_6/8_5e06TPR_16/PF13432_6/1_8e06TPR_16/PF13432_6/1_7e07TPR_16/PF13432_6/4_3e11TPR_1/PF00515_28/5_2TPR_1/PF00515_28/0_0014TPR_1/PF00515_28/5e05TPR_1/PF00515_28/4_8e07TPR_1/PF00515_28/0_0061TPR_9/PF13371_6/4e02TPR_9/PF13371_6/0_0039TPR